MNAEVVAEDLRNGLAKLERVGWTQGVYANASGRCCAMGALNHSWYVDDCAYFLNQAIGGEPEFPDELAHVFRWNDVPGRTFEEVKAVYLKAIELAERRRHCDRR